jgi:hypothetical protein
VSQRSFLAHISLAAFASLTFAISAFGQSVTQTAVTRPDRVAYGNDLYCAGFIQTSPISTDSRIIGAQTEADGFNFAQNDHVWLNMGADKGVKVGDVFSVTRPRGEVKSKWSKKGSLGSFVQELGTVQVVRVKANFSVARIKSSCDTFLLGDLLERYQVRASPVTNSARSMDQFGGDHVPLSAGGYVQRQYRLRRSRRRRPRSGR